MIQAPKGTADKFGAEVYAWQQVENVIRRLCADFRIGEIRTPAFEFTDLYKRGVGETSDVVQKEMYTFLDRGNRSFTLRPELTAGVARAFIENGLHSQPQPTKFYYIANAFRAEHPQKGRMIELNQFGIEFIGSYSPAADAEAISVAYELFRRLNIKNVKLYINSLGCPDCRPKFNAALKDYIIKNINGLCQTCAERAEKNPLRVLDCKNQECQQIMKNSPLIPDYLDEQCLKHFNAVQEFLTGMGISFVIDPQIVRGLDYYTRTVFEFVSDDLGAQSTVCGGGRYDRLIEEIGGAKTGACGFGLGLERLMIILDKQGNKPAIKPVNDVFIGYIGDTGFKRAQILVHELRKKGISAESDNMGRNVKRQMQYADKLGSKYSFIIGDDELNSNTVNIKDMATGEQTSVPIGYISDFIKR